MKEPHPFHAKDVRYLMEICGYDGRPMWDNQSRELVHGQHGAFDVDVPVDHARRDELPAHIDYFLRFCQDEAQIADSRNSLALDSNVSLIDLPCRNVYK